MSCSSASRRWPAKGPCSMTSASRQAVLSKHRTLASLGLLVLAALAWLPLPETLVASTLDATLSSAFQSFALAKALNAVISVLQAVVFLEICAVYGIRFSPMGYVAALPAMFLCALMVGALGIALSSTIRSLENFAGVMNFVIFPMFFLSTALYPLWKMAEASELLWWICAINPFSHGVETIRFALYLKADPVDWAITVAAVAVFMALALWGYDPGKRTMGRKG